MPELIPLVIICSYFLLTLFVGIRFRRQASASIDEFYLAGRGLSPLLLFFTMAATNFSAFTFFGLSGAGYRTGYAFFPIMAYGTGFMALSFFIIGLKILRLSKERRYVTPSDYISDRYRSPLLRVVFSCVLVVFTLPYIAIQTIAAGNILHSLIGVPYILGAAGVTLFITIYVSLGGLRSIAWTDVIQGGMILLLTLTAFVIIVRGAGGFVTIHQSLLESNPEHLSRPGAAGGFPPGIWMGYLVLWFFADPMFPQLFQRFMAARDEKSIKWTAILYPLICTFLFFITVSVGVIGKHVFPNLPLEETDTVFPLLLTHYAGEVISALLLTGSVAALMSTLDSQLLTVSSIIIRDLPFKRFGSKKFWAGKFSAEKMGGAGIWSGKMRGAHNLSNEKTGTANYRTDKMWFDKMRGSEIWSDKMKSDKMKSDKMRGTGIWSDKLGGAPFQTGKMKSDKMRVAGMWSDKMRAANFRTDKMKTAPFQTDKMKTAGLQRLVIAAIAGAGFLIALRPPDTILDFINKTSFSGLAVLAPTVIGGLYWRRGNRYGALSSIAAGEAMVLLFYFDLIILPLAVLPIIPILLVSFAVYAAVSGVTASLDGTTAEGARLGRSATERAVPEGAAVQRADPKRAVPEGDVSEQAAKRAVLGKAKLECIEPEREVAGQTTQDRANPEGAASEQAAIVPSGPERSTLGCTAPEGAASERANPEHTSLVFPIHKRNVRWGGVFLLFFILGNDFWNWDAAPGLLFGLPGWLWYFFVLGVLLSGAFALYSKRWSGRGENSLTGSRR